VLANSAFGGQMGAGWPATVIGTWAFALQIYGDFSGYSDIARGAAQLMGFHFMVNFRQPYLATSLQDFWRRWHISLSTWLRDYLYIPLGGNRKGERRTYVNLLATMLLGGLWHGANWTFVIWGLLHGGALAVERAMGGARRRVAASSWLWRGVKRIVVFQFVCLTWIFFRAASLGDAIKFIGNLFRRSATPHLLPVVFFLLFSAAIIMAMDLMMEQSGGEYVFQNLSPRLQIAAAVAELLMVALLSTGGISAFIYFQF
jgi:D-alanyl-lipoteichoic acid acyltransferase DltB (MBOAT superfamily)